MKEITTTTNRQLSRVATMAINLTDSHRKALRASYMQSPCFKDIMDKDAIPGIMEILFFAYSDTGQAIKGETKTEQQKVMMIMAKALLLEIRQYFSILTMDELAIAIANGIRHVYGDYFGLNLVTFHMFIKNFLDDDTRAEAIKRQKQHEQEQMDKIEQNQKIIIPEEKKVILMKDACIEAFDNYKSGKEIIDWGNAKYFFLNNNNLMEDITLEQRLQMLEQAKVNTLKAKQSAAANNLYDIIAVMKITLDDIGNEAQIEARNICLKHYFQILINNNTDIREVLNTDLKYFP